MTEVMNMAKQGMKRPEITKDKPKNEVPPVPEIQGKAKHGKARANPIISGIKPPSQKVYHPDEELLSDEDEDGISALILDRRNAGMEYGRFHGERPISSVYPVIDTDAARDNIENDLSAADLQDL